MGREGGNPDIVELGKDTRFPNNDPTKGGRPPSIKRQLSDLLKSEGNIVIPAEQIIQTRPDGSIVIKVPTEMQLAMKLKSLAMSKRGTDSIKAIKMIMEYIDGKPETPGMMPPGGTMIQNNTQININELSTEAALELKNLYRKQRGEDPIDV